MGGEDQILDKLRTDRKNGIKSSNMESRGKFFGTNKKAKAKLKTLWAFFMEAMEDLTLRILCVAAVISIGNLFKSFKFNLFKFNVFKFYQSF
jgi:magnesium-transporting ATPase (P-type)